MSRTARAALAVVLSGVLLIALGAPSTAVSKRCRPGVPVLHAASAWGGVGYRWTRTSCTTGYRLEVSPAPGGRWPGGPTYTARLPRSAHSLRWSEPRTPKAGDGMVGLAYGNPAYARVVAINGRNHAARGQSASRWVAQWPTAPVPRAGDPVRIGTYNVQDHARGARAAAAARNIGSHGVTIVALQEAQGDAGTARDVVATLNRYYGGHWDYVRTDVDEHNYNNTTNEVVYRTHLFRLVGADVISLADSSFPPYSMMNTVWASFRATKRDGGQGRAFYVIPAHLVGTPSASWGQDAWTGEVAGQLLTYLKGLVGSSPVIIAGDLRDTRQPWGERAGYVPAQAVFVRAGYYDAIASRSRVNTAYGTVNGRDDKASRTQRPYANGVGPRADYILMKGIRGSVRFVNVANWSYKGLVPSDHNLVYSDIDIPTS